MTSSHIRLRIKLENGREFEAEGPADLVLPEKESFLKSSSANACQEDRSMPQKASPEQADPQRREGGNTSAPWAQISEVKGGSDIYIKYKSPHLNAAETAMLVLAAAKMLAQLPSCTALQLSKALKKSGYFQGRLDRIIANEAKNGFIAPQGTKRNRTYSLTPKGLARAFTLAQTILKEQAQ